MIEHEQAQKESWNLSYCKTLAEKEKELAWIRRTVHDPLLFSGGLTTTAVIGWRFLGKLTLSFYWDLSNRNNRNLTILALGAVQGQEES
jgi:hypothetical protein